MRPLFIGILLFLIWSSLSTWYYVCHVNDFCDGAEVSQQVSKPETQPETERAALAETEPAEEITPLLPENLIIYFAFDRSDFKSAEEMSRFLSEYKAYIEKEPDSMLDITGHADATGTTTYNHALGMRRAESVKSYFVGQGIPAEMIETSSMGESLPVADNATPQGRAKNRRTEIFIKNQ
jgi:outer membrane protein OmpA-like peptidoglycan-associated protein